MFGETERHCKVRGGVMRGMMNYLRERVLFFWGPYQKRKDAFLQNRLDHPDGRRPTTIGYEGGGGGSRTLGGLRGGNS